MHPSERGLAVVYEFVGGTRTVQDALRELSAVAVEYLGAAMAGLTLNDAEARPKTVVYTDDMVPEIDEAQYQADRGPCLHAFRSGERVMIADTSIERRWPEFSATALRHGIQSTMSLPVIVGESSVGALNFYARRPDAFAGHSDEDTDLLARNAAIVAAHYDLAELADNLQRAMESRAKIEQAKGIIMATTGLDADEAFAALRDQSQRENRKLRDIATALVAQQLRSHG